MCKRLMVLALALALAMTSILSASQSTGADPSDGELIIDLDKVLNWTEGGLVGDVNGQLRCD